MLLRLKLVFKQTSAALVTEVLVLKLLQLVNTFLSWLRICLITNRILQQQLDVVNSSSFDGILDDFDLVPSDQ